MALLFCLGGSVLYNICFDISMPLHRILFLNSRNSTLTKSGGTSLRTALFVKLTLSPVSVQFSSRLYFSFLSKLGFLSAFRWLFHVPTLNRSCWISKKHMAHRQLLKSFKNCKELKVASLKGSLSNSVFLLRISVLIFFSFINWGKCLSAIILGPLERTEASAHCVRRNSRWSNCYHYYSLPKARLFTDSPYFRKLIQFFLLSSTSWWGAG